MKNKLKLFLPLVIMTIFFIGCKTEKPYQKDIYNYQYAANQAAKIQQTANTCNCLTQSQSSNCYNNAPNPTIIQFMGTAATKTFVVTWNNCLTVPYQNITGCNDPLSGVTSTLVMCYYDCYNLTAKFIGKPSCLPCMPDQFCIQLKPTKTTQNGNTLYVLAGTYNGEPLNNVQITVVVSGDPDVTIKCSTNITDPANSVSYTCYGNW